MLSNEVIHPEEIQFKDIEASFGGKEKKRLTKGTR
jgi:hypothetical protein